ncbi:MAG: hypothetical protein WBD02_10365, partial [Acidimicrobiia bacterium]
TAVTADGTAWYGMGSGAVMRVTAAGVGTRFAISSNGLGDAAVGPDGNVYFTDENGNLLWKVEADGTATSYSFGTALVSGPRGITAGPDGRMWIATHAPDTITAFDIGASTFAPYAIPDPNTDPQDVIVGLDGNLWFTGRTSGTIGSVTTAGIFSICGPLGLNDPAGLAQTADGNFWATERASNEIAQITPLCMVVEYPTTGLTSPREIISGPDGRLWFTAQGALATITTTGTVEAHPVIASSRTPMVAVAAPDGSVWFSEIAGNAIGHLHPDTGVIDTFEIRTPVLSNPSDWPVGIALAPDGSVWFTELITSSVGHLDPTNGSITHYPLSGPYQPLMISMGPDGYLWVSTIAGYMVRVDPTDGSMTDFPLQTLGTVPAAFGTGPDGNLWLPEEFGDAVTVMNTSGVVVNRIPLPAGSFPISAALGPDGNMWVTEGQLDSVARITPAGVVTQFPLPTAGSMAGIVVAGPDGNMWVSEIRGNKIARITMDGTVTEFAMPEANMRPTGIAVSSDGHLYVATQLGNQILKVSLGIPFASTTFGGAGQSAETGTAFSTKLSTRVTDSDGDPVVGVAVTFTAPTSGASGDFASSGITSIASVGATVLTDANGVATAPTFTANGTAGSYVVQATVAGLPSKIVNFAMTNTDPPPPTTTTTTTTTTSAAAAPTTAPPPTTAAPVTSTPVGAHPHVGRIVPRGALIRTGSDSTTALALSGAALLGLGGGALAFAARRRRRIA